MADARSHGRCLSGEVAVVTGAARGIGAAIADALEAVGARVARTDLSGVAIELDVRNRDSVTSAIEQISATLGEPTILVNNAGVNRIGPSETLSESSWHDVLDVNLTGTFRCSQVVATRMLASGGGSIVNVASIACHIGMPGRAAYAAAKAGMVGLTRALAVEWATRGIRVNSVAPSYVRTQMIENAFQQGLISENAVLDRIPLGRLASPAEIAEAVVFLASSQSSFVTGHTLFVDGGYIAYGAPGPASAVPADSYVL